MVVFTTSLILLTHTEMVCVVLGDGSFTITVNGDVVATGGAR